MRRGFGLDRRGTTAVEFAILAPAFLALVFGVFNLGLILFGLSTLQSATEAAARCFAVQTTVCSSATATQTWASTNYQGPLPSPTFVASTAGACHTTNGANDGYAVSATATYSLNAVIGSWSIPVSASACFP